MEPDSSLAGLPSPASEPVPAKPDACPCGRVVRCLMLLIAGAAAGALAFAGIAMFGFSFNIAPELASLINKERLTEEEANLIWAAMREREYKNTALQVAILGAAAGGLLGFAAGGAQRSIKSAAIGLFGGTVLGATAGAVGGVVDLFVLEQLWEREFEITFKSMAAHSAAFLIAGVGVAIVPGLVSRSLWPTLSVVLAAALIAGLMYSGTAAYFFPVPNTNAAVPIDGAGPLLLWTALPTMLMALGMARSRTALPQPSR